MKAVLISKASQKINVKQPDVTCSSGSLKLSNNYLLSFKWYEHIKVFWTVNVFLHFV